MSSFAFDLKGQLNNIRLSEKKALWPLYEAIVNSIQSIEDSPNSHRGKIKVIFDREEYTQLELDGKNVPERIENITIIDNGAGLNTDNYNSFNTAYSTFKIKKGCKGIGRFYG